MKLENIGSNVVVSHGQQELVWNVKVLDRSKRSRPTTSGVIQEDPEEALEQADPFYQLNQYLAYLSPEKQEQLFQIYNSIYQVFEVSGDFRELHQRISPLLKKIYEICPADNVSYWVRTISTIVIPSDIRVYETMEESIDADQDQYGIRNRPVESTYLRGNYWSLIVLIMMLRMIMPVWGRFMAATAELVGNDLKEFYALKLIGRTALIETDGYKRLEAYVQLHMSEEKIKNSAIAGKVAKEDFPFFMLSLVAVRRLAWVDFSGYNNTFSLVAWVYSFVEQNMNTIDRAFNEAIKPKIPESGSSHGDHENRSSVFELVKIKEPITTGRIGIMEMVAKRPDRIVARICPDMPPEILEITMAASFKLRNTPLHPGQILLLQCIMGIEVKGFDGEWDAVFNPRGVDELNMLEDLNLIAVAAAVLWYRGFKELAALICALPAPEQFGAMTASNAPPAPLTKENKELLALYWPHSPRPSGKKRTEGGRYATGANVAIENIEILREHLSRNSWILNLPKNWLDKIPNHNGSRRYAIKADIRNRLADLSIGIATRSI